jgi:hypothetical protein
MPALLCITLCQPDFVYKALQAPSSREAVILDRAWNHNALWAPPLAG